MPSAVRSITVGLRVREAVSTGRMRSAIGSCFPHAKKPVGYFLTLEIQLF